MKQIHHLLTILFLLGINCAVYSQSTQGTTSDTLWVCPGESTVLKASVATPADAEGGYIWFRNGDMIGTTTTETDSMIVTEPGSYALVCVNGGGCTSVISDPLVINIKQLSATDDYANTSCGMPVNIHIVVNDIEGCTPIDTPATSVVSLPLNGTLIPSVTGNYTYTPAPGYAGSDSFTYTVMDEDGNESNVATVYIDVVSEPLAVSLAYFNAVKWKNTQSLLSWSTMQEKESAYFAIERSADSRNFDSIGIVQATGNSNGKLNYEFTDSLPLAGGNFYRLKMTDLNGHSVYSDIRYLHFDEPSDIKIYPNPVSSILYVKTGKETPNLIELVDARGSVLQEFKPTSATLELDMSPYASGTYFIKVFTKDNRVLTYKVSKL